jgi:hypothetical protein
VVGWIIWSAGVYLSVVFWEGGVLYFVVVFVILYARVPFRLVFVHGNYTIVPPRQKKSFLLNWMKFLQALF